MVQCTKVMFDICRHLHLVRRSITQLPILCDMAIQALITTEVNPMEVEARMVALGIGLENLVGLLQIWEGNENMVSVPSVTYCIMLKRQNI